MSAGGKNFGDRYVRTVSAVYGRKGVVVSLRAVSYTIVAICAAVYCLSLVLNLCVKDYIHLVGILTVTGSSFIAVTVVRRIINAPRPYELIPVFDSYPKSKRGKSFPSRHVFSIFLISAVIAFDCLWAGIVLGFLGIILACCRVLTGIHFVRDAVAGAISGVLCGCVGMFIFMLLI